MRPDPKNNWAVMVGKYTTLAFLIPSTTFAGYAIGYLLDRWFGTHFLYLVFLLLGIAGGLIELIRQVGRDTDKTPPGPGPV